MRNGFEVFSESYVFGEITLLDQDGPMRECFLGLKVEQSVYVFVVLQKVSDYDYVPSMQLNMKNIGTKGLVVRSLKELLKKRGRRENIAFRTSVAQ